MGDYITLFVESVFVENLALAFFLGMCTFLAVSKKIETALGLGIAVAVIFRRQVRHEFVFLALFVGLLLTAQILDQPDLISHTRPVRFTEEGSEFLGTVAFAVFSVRLSCHVLQVEGIVPTAE